jgi:hypothetical protein
MTPRVVHDPNPVLQDIIALGEAMGKYGLAPASHRGLRIAEATTGTTIVLMNRVLDNLSEASAMEIIDLLERRDRLHRDHLEAAAARNDLGRLFEEMQASGA